ncbi:reverse transcriptase [Phytophthora megakarya]|uniref:Reverse transcriptase n=1 Tax=Phytophthora megakarya TaxID=4795 RepID=A0A225V3B7_9STRA|nr:reverse transcriptase [Phytophthora megakarya]
MPDQATDRTGTKDIKTEDRTGIKDIEPKAENQTQIRLDQGQIKLDPDAIPPICHTESVEQRDPPTKGPAATNSQDAEDEVEIYYHDSGDLSPEDLEGNLAVLPEIPISTTAKVSIEDLQGLLAAEIIRPSTPPWASPIVIVRKSNGVDIRLCIDYKMVNSLTRLMVYPMPLISDLLEDLDKALWYCSLDMASGFWVVPMTDRAREISAFITPFGLFEWSRMPFGLKNAPQIYQRLVDNALYGFLEISRSGDAGATTDVFQTGIVDDPDRESVLGRRSYIDEIMIAAESWDQMCRRAEDLLEACDKWNLSISVAKSFWGMDKVGYLGHRVSIGGLEASPMEASPKDLKSLTDLPFPGSLRSMQSFLGSLNYYSRIIEYYAIYASVLYELREMEFTELEKRSDLREILDRNDPIPRDHDPTELNGREAHRAFTALKTKIATTPVLRHFDETRTPGRLGQWSALLAPWTLEITKCSKGEDEILGAIAASITPRAKIDDALTEIAPRKEAKRRIQTAIVWSLPGWEVVKARSGYLESLTVNEAEYNGLILGLDMIDGLVRRRLVICGDSNLVVRQVRGEIDCKAPELTLLKRKALGRLRKWNDHELVHVKRDWNGSADSLASAALQRQRGIEVQATPGYQELVTLNRLDAILIPKTENPVVRVAAVTTRAGRARSPAGVMDEGLIREILVDRIKRKKSGSLA